MPIPRSYRFHWNSLTMVPKILQQPSNDPIRRTVLILAITSGKMSPVCPFSPCPLFVHYSWLLSSWVNEFSYGTRTPAAEPAAGGESQVLAQTTRASQAGAVLDANPSSVSPANSSRHSTWQSSSNQTAAVAAQAAREAERDVDRDARRDLVLVSWRCYAKNTRKRKCSKRTGQEGWPAV